jgi:predicted phage terminase large subunit-like protein
MPLKKCNLRHLTPEMIKCLKTPMMETMIHLARIDPCAFLQWVLKGPGEEFLPMAEIHNQLQNHLTDHRLALVELPRDHGKTTQVCLRVLWELGRNPNLRIKIVCASDALAAERTRFLRRSIERNPHVKMVFPNLQPSEPWTAEAFTVKRTTELIGPSVAAFGIGTSATGARADLLICDDVVDVRAISSRQERQRAKEYFRNNLLNLLEPQGRFWGLCTPWHPDDLNAELKATEAYAVFRKAIGADLEPVWPEKWNRERLEMRKNEIGEAGFARGYRLTPMSESELLIQAEWIVDYAEIGLPEKVILSIDPAVTANSKADASAVVALGRMPQSNEVRVLEALAYRVTMPDLVGKIAEAEARWKPSEILFESNAAFAGIRDLLVRHAKFGPKIRGIVQSRSKASRFAGFSVMVQNGTVTFASATQRELIEEMTTFPHGMHDDLLDATAMGVEHLQGVREPRIWI